MRVIHVLMLGCREECVRALAATGHTISVLYEPGHVNAVRAVATHVANAHVVDSYRSVDAVLAITLRQRLDSEADLVVTAHEFAVVTASVIGASLGVSSLSPRVAVRCRDKFLQKSLWRASGVKTARVVELDPASDVDGIEHQLEEEGIAFPVVLKPRDSAGAMSVFIVHNAHKVHDLVRNEPGLRAPLAEEFVTGPEWHFDGIAGPAGLAGFTVSRYGEPLLCTKAARPVTSVTFAPDRNEDLYRQARDFTSRALAAVGLDCGAFHLEVFGQPGAWTAGELACRPGGALISMVNELVVGVDLWRAHVWSFTGDSFATSREPSGRTYGYVHLPSVAGEPNRVTAAQVEALPGVVHADVRVPVGAIMDDMSTSSLAGIGFAAVAADDEMSCWRALDEVAATVLRHNTESMV